MGGYGPMVAASIVDRANEIHEDNKQKKDEEHARKISDLILERQELVNKIPTLQQGTPEYMDAHTALQGVNGDIADVYHPQKNPGAIEKFGHLLTDHMKITNPEDRVVKQAGQQQARTDASAKTTDRQIAAAPLSPAQVNTQRIDAALKEIDASNLDDEGKKRAREKVFGVTSVVKPNWQQYKLADGVTIRSYDLNNPDNPPPDGATELPKGSMTAAKENIANYDEAVKGGYKGSFTRWMAQERRAGAPSTSGINLYAAAYQRAYGITPEQMTPGDWDFINRKLAYDRAIPQTTTTNTTKQNFQQQWVPVQETNTKSPGGAAPSSPRGKPLNNTLPPSREDLSIAEAPQPAAVASGAPAAPQGAAQPPAATPTSPAAAPATTAPPAAAMSPRALKKEVEARNPSKTSTSASPAAHSTGANASVKVGTPLFAAPSKNYNDAMGVYQAALTRQTQMHKNLKDALGPKGSQQAMLALLFNHIGMTQGAQKGARINQKSVDEAKASTPWVDAKIAQWFHQDKNGDYIFDGLKGGVTLTKPQMEQMVELADESTDTFKQNVDRIAKTLNDGVQYPSGPTTGGGGETKNDSPPKATKPAPPKATHYKKHGDKWYYTDDKGNNLGEVI